MKTAVFRVDASNKIGHGHLYRCMTLAHVLHEYGYEIYFISIKFDSFPSGIVVPYTLLYIEEKSDSESFKEYEFNEEEDSLKTISVLPKKCDLLIVDHYAISEKWESQLKQHCCNILVIDDLANRSHECDYLVDTLPGRQQEEYLPLVNMNAKLFLGPDYALLREDFYKTRNLAKIRRDNFSGISNIIISFGGSDTALYVEDTLNKLIESGYTEKIKVVMSSSQAEKVEILKDRFNSSDTSFHMDIKNMAEELVNADLAIGAVGVSSFERCCLGLPSLAMVIAGNQDRLAHELDNRQVVTLLDQNFGSKALKELLDRDKEYWKRISYKAFKLCDGLGAFRLASRITGQIPKIKLRKVKETDCDLLYQWQIEPGNRKFSRDENIPLKEDHEIWFKDKLSSNTTAIYIVQFRGMDCGYVRLDHYDDQSEEVSIMLSKQYRGLGLAKAALKSVTDMTKYDRLMAEIHPNNEASKKIFLSSGYQQTSEREYIWVRI